MSYISISATDAKGKSSTLSASAINDTEKQRAKDLIDSLVNDADAGAGGEKQPA